MVVIKGRGKDWRHSERNPESHKREIMRRAKSAVENNYGPGGMPKQGVDKPRPVTLPKMPWDAKEPQ
jgi:hypothetical protein